MADSDSENIYSVQKLTDEARRLAADYRRATGKTLPLSAEIAVNDAIRLLGMEATSDDDTTCDAIRTVMGKQTRAQIKGRVIFDQSKSGHRLGQLKLDQDWDETLLVLMDEDYQTHEIYAATHKAIESALEAKAPNKRGAMTVNQFKVIAERVWPTFD